MIVLASAIYQPRTSLALSVPILRCWQLTACVFQSTEAFLRDPDDLYLLRLAAGSISGVLTNIDADGAPAMAFHGDPSLMAWDPASGDHGDSESSTSDNRTSRKLGH